MPARWRVRPAGQCRRRMGRGLATPCDIEQLLQFRCNNGHVSTVPGRRHCPEAAHGRTPLEREGYRRQRRPARLTDAAAQARGTPGSPRRSSASVRPRSGHLDALDMLRDAQQAVQTRAHVTSESLTYRYGGPDSFFTMRPEATSTAAIARRPGPAWTGTKPRWASSCRSGPRHAPGPPSTPTRPVRCRRRRAGGTRPDAGSGDPPV